MQHYGYTQLVTVWFPILVGPHGYSARYIPPGYGSPAVGAALAYTQLRLRLCPGWFYILDATLRFGCYTVGSVRFPVVMPVTTFPRFTLVRWRLRLVWFRTTRWLPLYILRLRVYVALLLVHLVYTIPVWIHVGSGCLLRLVRVLPGYSLRLLIRAPFTTHGWVNTRGWGSRLRSRVTRSLRLVGVTPRLVSRLTGCYAYTRVCTLQGHHSCPTRFPTAAFYSCFTVPFAGCCPVVLRTRYVATWLYNSTLRVGYCCTRTFTSWYGLWFGLVTGWLLPRLFPVSGWLRLLVYLLHRLRSRLLRFPVTLLGYPLVCARLCRFGCYVLYGYVVTVVGRLLCLVWISRLVGWLTLPLRLLQVRYRLPVRYGYICATHGCIAVYGYLPTHTFCAYGSLLPTPFCWLVYGLVPAAFPQFTVPGWFSSHGLVPLPHLRSLYALRFCVTVVTRLAQTLRYLRITVYRLYGSYHRLPFPVYAPFTPRSPPRVQFCRTCTVNSHGCCGLPGCGSGSGLPRLQFGSTFAN